MSKFKTVKAWAVFDKYGLVDISTIGTIHVSHFAVYAGKKLAECSMAHEQYKNTKVVKVEIRIPIKRKRRGSEARTLS